MNHVLSDPRYVQVCPPPHVRRAPDFGFVHARVKEQRFALVRLLKRLGMEKVTKAVEYAVKVREEKFAPKIFSFEDLEKNYEKLRFYHTQNAER